LLISLSHCACYLLCKMTSIDPSRDQFLKHTRTTSYYYKRTRGFWGYPDALRLHGSVIPHIAIHVIVVFLFSLSVCILHIECGINLSVSNAVVPSLSVVLGLVLVFRTNTAYDRFWDGRKLFSQIGTTVGNLTRTIWLSIPMEAKPVLPPYKDPVEKEDAINWLLGYMVSLKHKLRGEHTTNYEDMLGLLPCGLTEYANQPGAKQLNIPLEIVYRLSAYNEALFSQTRITTNTYTTINTGLNTLQGIIYDCERIRGTPIPLAYLIHMKQSVLLFCFALPFTMVGIIGYLTMPVTTVVAFTLFGIDGIGAEIENPFGDDWNDLRMDFFCEVMENERSYVMERFPGLSKSTVTMAAGH